MSKRRIMMIVGIICILLNSAGIGLAQGVDMTLWVNCWPQPAIDAIQAAADIFAERNPEVNSVYVDPAGCSGSELMEKLIVTVIGGSPPDVATLPAPFAEQAMSGLLRPLGRWIDDSDVIFRDDYSPFMMETFGFAGEEYGVPALEAALGLVFIYSKELFAESGLADRGPETLDELYAMHQRLTRLHPSGDQLEQVGMNPMDAMGGYYFPLIWGTVFDVDWYDDDDRRLHLTRLQEAIDYVKMIYDAPGYDLITGSGFGGWTGALASGRVAMQVNGSWVPGELNAFEDVGEFGYTWMPSVKGDRATSSSPWGMGIPANAPRPDLSFRLIEFFSTAEALQIVFDSSGWLNGNLAAIRELDISSSPEIAPIIDMFAFADRLTAPPPIPIMTEIYGTMEAEIPSVFRGEQDARILLESLQEQMQARLNEVFAQ